MVPHGKIAFAVTESNSIALVFVWVAKKIQKATDPPVALPGVPGIVTSEGLSATGVNVHEPPTTPSELVLEIPFAIPIPSAATIVHGPPCVVFALVWAGPIA
jgi:hypothetical protein